MNHSVKICNENFEFCTRMYTRSTMNGIEFVFNNQTVLIFLLLERTVCGIDLLSFKVHANPINSLFTRHEKSLMGHLTDVSHMSHWFLGFAFAIRDMIGCGMMCGDITTNSFTFSLESCWDVTKSVAFLESH